MRSSLIRSGIAALVSAIALAACGGHGIVPQSAAPGSSFGAQRARAKSPCANPKLPWYFKGSCVASILTSKGGTVKLAPYKGITATISLYANSAKGKVAFVTGDALGKGDITGKTAFPLYGSKTCAKGSNCTGTTLVYLEAVNSSKATIKFTGSQAAQLVIASKKFPGKSCGPALLSAKGWVPYNTILVAQPKKGKLTLKIPNAGIFVLPAGAAYIDLICS